jgi:hypothetical protein
MKQMTVEQFLFDVKLHVMTVRQDNERYRHLLFKSPKDSWNMWFEIVTWPNSLMINGDMGAWSFSRVEDMFMFFRSDKLDINASYWAEKIISESRFGGPSERFDMDTYKENVLSRLDGYELYDSQFKKQIIEALNDEVFRDDSDESTARRDLVDFKHGAFQFTESWEINGKAYTYHFLWCLYAIVWGIQQYDAAKAVSPTGITPAGLVADAG